MVQAIHCRDWSRRVQSQHLLKGGEKNDREDVSLYRSTTQFAVGSFRRGSKLHLVKKESKPVSKAIGAPNMETFRFEAVKAGQTALKLVYHRPWEKNVDVEPSETFSVQVVIR